eukprot:TRINITY_DN6515_c0_g1_i1.p1 TRINITY_DN6515_c0_g1~~TRINITY_DN6515_c0_g1_i1.p1  ORF type:complete len:315 (-),score=51.56 TRINITY_DN6515_c0_g1_i1:88-1032(-)
MEADGITHKILNIHDDSSVHFPDSSVHKLQLEDPLLSSCTSSKLSDEPEENPPIFISSSEGPSSPFSISSLKNSKWKIILLVLGLVLVLVLGTTEAAQVGEAFIEWVQDQGPIAYIFYLLLFVLFSVFAFPVGVLTFSSGLVLGLWQGAIISFIGSLLGAWAAFFVGKKLLHSFVEDIFGENPWLGVMRRAMRVSGWKLIFLLRMSPLLPFNIMNYVLSLTEVSFSVYASSTAAGIFLPTILWVYFGTIATSLQRAVAHPDPVSSALLAVAVAVTVLSVGLIGHITGKIVRRELDNLGTSNSVEPAGSQSNFVL